MKRFWLGTVTYACHPDQKHGGISQRKLKVPTLSSESDIIQLIIKVRFEVELLQPKFLAGGSEKFRKAETVYKY